MRIAAFAFAVLVLMISTGCAARDLAGPLIPEGAVVEKVADGYRFTEGPAAGPDDKIYFTDIPAELILRFDPETGQTEVYASESGRANGLAFNTLGNLVACRHGGRDVAVLDILRTRAADNVAHWGPPNYATRHIEGTRLNSPNDLTIDSEGGIYFTDPRYGNRDNMEMETEGVYYAWIELEGLESLQKHLWHNRRIIDDLVRPNGIVLSPNESILYVADAGANVIYVYDIESPGKIVNQRAFARLNNGEGRGGPDGMCVDRYGRVYAAGQEAIWIYNLDGSDAGKIDVGAQCTNCTFANDGRTLYITADHGLYRIELNTDAAAD